MKKLISCILIFSLLLAMGVTAAAAEGCVISADFEEGSAGEEITVPVRITNNPGFTNFAVTLDYDREQLTLLSINTADGDTAYLCGGHVSVNTDRLGEDGKSYGYISCANAEAVSEDGILFTVSFRLSEGFADEAAVTPIVSYTRNNTALFSVFEEISVSTAAGGIKLPESSALTLGDINGDGSINVSDAAMVYRYVNNNYSMTEDQIAAADVNGDETINVNDAALIYRFVNNSLASFPGSR